MPAPDNREPALSHQPGQPMVVVVSQAADASAAAMCDALAERAISHALVDPSQFEPAMILDVRLRKTGRWVGELRTRDNTIAIEEVSAIYYRAQQPWVREPGSNSSTGAVRQVVPGPRAHSRAVHARVALFGMLMSLPCRWVNFPCLSTDEHRLSSLTAAITSGFTLPPSLLATRRQAVNDFMTEAGENVLATPLVDPETGHPYSRPVLRTEYRHHPLDGFLFQAYVEHDRAVRVIVAGHRHFGFEGQHDLYSLTDIPPDITAATDQLMEATGLRYATLDFVVPPEGPWVLTRVDPNADWSWYATHFDLPIASALVDALVQD
ncbi:hypothetical protein GCM10009765_01750 [Fodinicola feengrottensis]|uniref:ATP-grasp domain-containing protein n=1 Tax=Fodinicola feengrottensis TaxID=435914 RepID=A0ABN2FPW6_9ACTN